MEINNRIEKSMRFDNIGMKYEFLDNPFSEVLHYTVPDIVKEVSAIVLRAH